MNYMSSLDKIQKLSKLGKILCSIVFVFCVIGIIGSVVGIAFLAAGVDAIHIGGVTLKSIVQTNSGTSIETANIYMAVAIILCSGEAVIAKFAEHYFKGELLDGTPFNMERSKELTRLLLKHYNILIKDCSTKSAFNSSNYIRIAIRDTNDNNTLINALKNFK